MRQPVARLLLGLHPLLLLLPPLLSPRDWDPVMAPSLPPRLLAHVK